MLVFESVYGTIARVYSKTTWYLRLVFESEKLRMTCTAEVCVRLFISFVEGTVDQQSTTTLAARCPGDCSERAMPATQMSRAGCTTLTCLSQPLQCLVVDIWRASVLFRASTDLQPADQAQDAVGTKLARAPESATDRVWACYLCGHLQYKMDIKIDAPHVCSGHRIVSLIAMEKPT